MAVWLPVIRGPRRIDAPELLVFKTPPNTPLHLPAAALCHTHGLAPRAAW